MIRLSGYLICASEEEADLVRKFLPDHIELTRAETGCLSFEVKETTDPLVWEVQELFGNQEVFKAHQARVKSSEWGIITAEITREYVISEL